MLFTSLDGGATKTIAVTYDIHGEILGVGVKGPSNFRNIGVDGARENVKLAIEESLAMADVSWSDIDFFTFAMAGVKDSEKSTAIIEDFVSSYRLGNRYTLLNDGEMGFRCRFPDMDGIIGAPGTGMIAYGKKEGRFERCSGWGWFIGDEGGAFYIGKRAIQTAAMIADGRIETTSGILNRLMSEFGVNEPRKLVNEVYTTPLDIRRIASLARIISELSKTGDAICTEILEEAATEVARCVIALENRLSNGAPLPVSGYGGVYRSGEVYWSKLKEKVMEIYPEVSFRDPLPGYQAVLGSMHSVLEDKGVRLGFDEVTELSRSLEGAVMKLPAADRSKYLFM